MTLKVIQGGISSLHGGPICLLNPFNPIWMNNRNTIGVRVKGDDGSILEAGQLEHHARIEWQGRGGVVYRVETVKDG